MYIAANLKPLRDFFLVLFFFSLGVGFKLELLVDVIVPAVVLAAVVLAAVVLAAKPAIFRVFLFGTRETQKMGWEVGFRLGQISEFSLLIAFIASANRLIGDHASHLVQATTIITLLVSSYIVVFRYLTPIAVSDALRRD